MTHTLYRATLALHTPLGTPLAGDTLFGQLCWALREAQGEAELTRLLVGYTAGAPWLVVSDGFPAGYLPKPTVPQHFAPEINPELRKKTKKSNWIPLQSTAQSLVHLLASDCVVDDKVAYGAAPLGATLSHNTIDRLTGTTGEAAFTPFTTSATFYAAAQKIDVYLVLNETRIAAANIQALLSAVGASGFGRDASTGLGKFSVVQMQPHAFAVHPQANTYLTLAPSAPQGQGFVNESSYWRTLTRFGRHGNIHAVGGNPFKTPILLAATGAIFKPAAAYSQRLFIGQGLGGAGKLSKAEPATVHQGYAPVMAVALPTTTPAATESEAK